MVSWEFFLTKGKDVGSKHYNEGVPPKDDHGYGFKKEKQEVYYIYQPYFAPYEIEEVKNWANRLNLEYEIFDKDKSWYYKRAIMFGCNICKKHNKTHNIKSYL